MTDEHPKRYLEVIFADAGIDPAKARNFTKREAATIVQRWINDLKKRAKRRLTRTTGTVEDYLLVTRGDLLPLRIICSKQIVANLK